MTDDGSLQQPRAAPQKQTNTQPRPIEAHHEIPERHMNQSSEDSDLPRTADVVVGVDGSTSSQHALQWAHAYCTRRQQPLTALVAWDDNDLPSVGYNGDGPSFDRAMRTLAESLVNDALGTSHTVTCRVSVDRPRTALARASETASLLVVGARGLGGFRGLLMGSVSRHLLNNARCPVAVIRHIDHEQAGPVIVGVDGSEPALRALTWASLHAAVEQRALVAVYAWQLPIMPATHSFILVSTLDQLRADAPNNLARAVTRAELAERADEIEQCVVEGGAASELLNIADQRHASLLVVGARSKGRLGALLGSVSAQVSQHAPCPVVVVP